jgi:hypothetical protein
MEIIWEEQQQSKKVKGSQALRLSLRGTLKK